MTDAVSIEQINKIRISLGQAPLPVPGQGPQFKDTSADDGAESDVSDDLSTVDKRQAAADGNWQKLEAERQERIDRQKRKDKAKKARDQAQRFQNLEGKGLGDADDAENVLDTRTWLLQQKKRQKQIEKARKLEEDLVAREQEAVYDTKDLAGVKVGHSVDQFDEITGEQILTLKDAEIGEESEEDELENADLKAQERLEEKLRLKKKRPDYDPTEQNEGGKILSKYDEEIDGKQQKRFTLDGQGTSLQAARAAQESSNKSTIKGINVTLDILKDDAPTSDYLDPSTIKIKKPKKSKKEKKSRQKSDDDGFPALSAQEQESDPSLEMQGDSAGSKKRSFDFDDDDDLQAKLAEQRRLALKKRKKMDAADLARQMREEMEVDEAEPEEGGLVIDETSAFIANLKNPDMDEVTSRRTAPPQANAIVPPAPSNPDGDEPMGEPSYADVEEADEGKERQAREGEDITNTGLEDEETMMDQGAAATLAMLRKRGLVSAEGGAAAAEQERQRMRFKVEKQQLLDEYDLKAKAQREEDRRSGRFDKLSNRERDDIARRQNEDRERYVNRMLADKFNKEYKPDVVLRYNDEFGREMTPKEAFKHLSHMFHGKGSGKQKTEKRLKKIEDEKRDMAKGTLNVGEERGMMDVQGREGRRQKTAGVRLQ